jgi:hypothetical protein
VRPSGPEPLLPAPDRDTGPFWEHLRAHELRVQRCDGCDHLRFPPRPVCPACRGFDATWARLSGRGRIWSHVVVHAPVLPAFEPHVPYPVVVVELDEAPHLRMVGNVVAAPGADIDSVDPGALVIGTPVEVTFHDLTPDVTLPRWLLTSPLASTVLVGPSPGPGGTLDA